MFFKAVAAFWWRRNEITI